MNALVVGSDKEPILQYASDCFLFIDDGPLIEQLEFPERRAVTFFDVAKHSFDPLKDISYRKATDFLDVLNAAFPEGESTLTKRNSDYQILKALDNNPRRLATLIKDTKDTRDAYQKIQRLLLSPVLKRVLTTPTGPSTVDFKKTIVARLDRSVLGDFDCFVLANLLISQFRGTVIIPDFGFYQCPFHAMLLRQDRLIAGINSFDEVPKFKQRLLLVDQKTGSHCIPDDAKLLALYEGLHPDPARQNSKYNEFIQRNIA